MTTHITYKTCLNLKELYGSKYKIEIEEPYTKRDNDPWTFIIPGKRGHVYPYGGEELCAYYTHRAGAAMLAIPGVTKHQSGDSEGTVRFNYRLFKEIAKILQLKTRRPKPQLSPERLFVLSENLKRANAARQNVRSMHQNGPSRPQDQS